MTYIMLNLIFVVVIFVGLLLTGQLQKLRLKPILATLAVLLIATAVFDNVIIQLGLVTYDTAKILGLYIGKAPIEDFAYTIVMVVLIPVLWRINGALNDK